MGNMGNMDTFVNAMIFLGGGYMLFAAYMMKFKGEVPKSFLSRDLNWDTARDKEGYIRFMFPANIIMGLLMIILGLCLTFEEKLGLVGDKEMILLLAAFILVLIYGVIAMHMQTKYLR